LIGHVNILVTEEGPVEYWPTKVAIVDKPPLDIQSPSPLSTTSPLSLSLSSLSSSTSTSTSNRQMSVSNSTPMGATEVVGSGWADIDLDLDVPLVSPPSNVGVAAVPPIVPAAVVVGNGMTEDDLLSDLPLIARTSITPLHRRAGSDASESLLREVDALLGEVDPLSPLPSTHPTSDEAKAAAAAADADLFSLTPPAVSPSPPVPLPSLTAPSSSSSLLLTTPTRSISPPVASATATVAPVLSPHHATSVPPSVSSPSPSTVPSVPSVPSSVGVAAITAPVVAAATVVPPAQSTSFSYFDSNNDGDGFGVTEDDFLAAAPVPVASPTKIVATPVPPNIPIAAVKKPLPPSPATVTTPLPSTIAPVVASITPVAAPSTVAAAPASSSSSSSAMDYFGGSGDDLFGGDPTPAVSHVPTPVPTTVATSAPSTAASAASSSGAFSYFGDNAESDAGWLGGSNASSSTSNNHGRASSGAANTGAATINSGGFNDYFSSTPAADDWGVPAVAASHHAHAPHHPQQYDNRYATSHHHGSAHAGYGNDHNTHAPPPASAVVAPAVTQTSDWQYGGDAADPFPPIESINHHPTAAYDNGYPPHTATATVPSHDYYGGHANAYAPHPTSAVTAASNGWSAPVVQPTGQWAGYGATAAPSTPPVTQPPTIPHVPAVHQLPSTTVPAAAGRATSPFVAHPPSSSYGMPTPLPAIAPPSYHDSHAPVPSATATATTSANARPLPPPVGMLPTRPSYESTAATGPVTLPPSGGANAFAEVPLSPRGTSFGGTGHTAMMRPSSEFSGAPHSHHHPTAVSSSSAPVMATAIAERPYTPRAPCAVATFGFGGQLITIYPRAQPSQRFGGGEIVRASPVYIQPLSTLINETPLGRGLSAFPGPLVKTKDNEKVLSYLSDRIQDPLGADDTIHAPLPNDFKDNVIEENTAKRVLWLIVRELWHHQATVTRARGGTGKDSKSGNDEKKGDNVEQGAIRVLLDPANNVSLSSLPDTPAAIGALPHSTSSEWLAGSGSGIGGGAPGQPSIRVSPEKSLGGLAPRPIKDRNVNTVAGGLELVEQGKREDEAIVAVQRLLLSGKRQEACQLAVGSQLWSHALLLASFEPATYTNVLARYALSSFSDGSPLQSLYLLFAQQPAALFRGLPSSGDIHDLSSAPPLIRNWKSNVAIMLANPTPNDSAVIVQLADALWAKYGLVSAAHVCYLLAGHGVGALDHIINPAGRVVLIGADHRRGARTFADPWSIQRSEIMEYARQQMNPMFSLPSLQVGYTTPIFVIVVTKYAPLCMIH
jgi:hypothetical protein